MKDRPYNKKIGPFYLKWFRRGNWYVWFHSNLLMAYHRTRNNRNSYLDHVPLFKLRMGKLSVDYD